MQFIARYFDFVKFNPSSISDFHYIAHLGFIKTQSHWMPLVSFDKKLTKPNVKLEENSPQVPLEILKIKA